MDHVSNPLTGHSLYATGVAYQLLGVSTILTRYDEKSRSYKAPCGSWKESQNRIYTNQEWTKYVATHENHATGVGIICGAVSGNLLALDLDIEDEGMRSRVRAAVDVACGDSMPLWYSGRRLSAILRTTQNVKGYECKLDDKNVIEVRSDGKYVVAPGSKHSDDEVNKRSLFYSWTDPAAPLVPSSIPMLSDEQWKAVDTVLRSYAAVTTQDKPKPSTKQSNPLTFDTTSEDVKNKINSIYSVDDLLLKLGYKPNGSGYDHPSEEHGPSVEIIGESSNHRGAKDPIRSSAFGTEKNGIYICDSYALLCILRSYTDKTVAMREIARELGMSPTTATSVKGESRVSNDRKPTTPIKRAGTIRSFADVKAKAQNWLWRNRFPDAALCSIDGRGGLGKSTIVYDMAARISKGGRWPVDDTPCPQGRTILFSPEDSEQTVIKCRLIAAGADCSMIHPMPMTRTISVDGSEQESTFSLDDLEPVMHFLACV